jgi:hypothetical protein
MNNITLYTLLYGDSLCNLISNYIVYHIESISPKNYTEIITIISGNLIIVKGFTNILHPIDISTIIKNYLKNNFNLQLNSHIIDDIVYGKIQNNEYLIVEYTNVTNKFTQKYSELLLNEYRLSNQGYVSLCQLTGKILSNNEKLILGDNFYNTTGSDKVYTSDPFFGNSLNEYKIYSWFLRYISENILRSGICDDIQLKMIINKNNLSKLDYDSFDFNIHSESSLYKKSNIKSMILDLFNFNINDIVKNYNLKNINFFNDIKSSTKSWMIYDKSGEMILF